MPAANYVAFTAPINPPGSLPSGETFVGGAITSTNVLKTGHTEAGLPYTDREIIFADGNRKVQEHCVVFRPMKVEFHGKDNSRVMNIISQGAGGEEDLYMTYTFEYPHPELEDQPEELAKKKQSQQKMAKVAVESTIEVMRKLANEGKI